MNALNPVLYLGDRTPYLGDYYFEAFSECIQNNDSGEFLGFVSEFVDNILTMRGSQVSEEEDIDWDGTDEEFSSFEKQCLEIFENTQKAYEELFKQYQYLILEAPYTKENDELFRSIGPKIDDLILTMRNELCIKINAIDISEFTL